MKRAETAALADKQTSLLSRDVGFRRPAGPSVVLNPAHGYGSVPTGGRGRSGSGDSTDSGFSELDEEVVSTRAALRKPGTSTLRCYQKYPGVTIAGATSAAYLAAKSVFQFGLHKNFLDNVVINSLAGVVGPVRTVMLIGAGSGLFFGAASFARMLGYNKPLPAQEMGALQRVRRSYCPSRRWERDQWMALTAVISVAFAAILGAAWPQAADDDAHHAMTAWFWMTLVDVLCLAGWAGSRFLAPVSEYKKSGAAVSVESVASATSLTMFKGGYQAPHDAEFKDPARAARVAQMDPENPAAAASAASALTAFSTLTPAPAAAPTAVTVVQDAGQVLAAGPVAAAKEPAQEATTP